MENKFELRAVDPVKPPAAYIGGKKQLASHVIKHIEAIPHGVYCEPFVGMGGVFFRRRNAPKVEVINDLSGDVATLFRVLQRHYVPFIEMLRWQITSRREFERLRATPPATLTDLERSARFIYLQRLAFGGKVMNRAFGMAAERPGRFNITTLAPLLEQVHERLAGVVIESLSYADFIQKYDKAGTLFYLDPPYFGSEGDYGREAFSRADFERLAGILAGLKGRFIMSINDRRETRTIFRDFRLQQVDVTYTVSRGGAQRAKELIVSG